MTTGIRVAVVIGVSGSGKSTLAARLADAWPATYLDADDFHSDEARARMAGGAPLTDAMRDPWVARIAAELQRRAGAGAGAGAGERIALAFSGLRRRHRDRLRDTGLALRFLFLDGDRALIAHRLLGRTDHYMPPALLDSQFETLEVPTDESDVIAMALDLTPEQQLQAALVALAAAD